MNRPLLSLFTFLLIMIGNQVHANIVNYNINNFSGISLEYIVQADGCSLRIQNRGGGNSGTVCKYGIISQGETKEINYVLPILHFGTHIILSLWDEKGGVIARCEEYGDTDIQVSGVSPNIYTENDCNNTYDKFLFYQIPSKRWTT